MDHWGIWDWTKFICCNRPVEIANDTNGLKQRSFYESDIGYTAQEIHEQHQRLHHLVQQQLQQHQLSSHRGRSEDDPDDQDTDLGNDSCLHDAQRRSVIGYNNSSVNLYEDTSTYRHSSTLLGLNPHNDYERLKGRASEIDSINPSRRNNLNNNNTSTNNSINNSKNANRNSEINSRTSSKTLLDITNHQHYPHQLITMDGLRNQLVRRKSGTGSASTTALRPPTVERCDQLQVTLRGWLYRLEGGAIKQWKRRWFVLGDYCLFYYKDSNEEKCHGSILLPSYRVSLCRSSEDGITRKHSFKLEHQNMKTYFLAADSKESMDQWMTALNLASIMQLNYGSSNSNGNSTVNLNSLSRRDLSSVQQQAATITGNLGGYGTPEGINQPDGSDVTDSRIMMLPGSMAAGNVKGYPTRCMTGGGGGEEEEDSGFNSYIPRRPPMPNSLNNLSADSSGYLPAGAKYPGSYNCIGLPQMSYRSSSYLAGHSGGNPQQLSSSVIYPPPATHQKRSHYANAPPKPRRQQLDESGVLNCSDLYPVTNEFGAIPPGSVYNSSNNQYFGSGNGPAPDLIAHNNTNPNVTNASPNGGNGVPGTTSNDPNNSISSNSSTNVNNSNQNGPNGVSSNNTSSYYQGSPFNPSDYPQNDGLNMQYQLTSPTGNQHYSIPPPSQFTMSTNQLSGYHPHHHHHIQQQIQSQQAQQQSQPQSSTSQYTRTRLPPRPHSADFLDREVHDDDEMNEIENCYQTGDNVNHNSASSTKSNAAHQQFYQSQQQQSTSSTAHRNNGTGQPDTDPNSNNTNQQSIQPPKILPIRPKSSLERYDPYYYTNQIEYGSTNGPVNQQSQQLTSPSPRPWSDYLQQQAARQNGAPNQQQPLQATTSNGLPVSRPKGANLPPSNLDLSPRGQQDRDVSLLRLLEWKQKMLSGPLNKRNNSSNNMTTSTGGGSKGIVSGSAKPPHNHLPHSHHLNNSVGSDLTFSDVPMRPPLPKEYRNKMGLPDSRDYHQSGGFMGASGEMRSREEPIFSRERSKSIGSSFPVADITYSSDDEAIKLGSNETNQTGSTVNRVRRRHESCGNPLVSSQNNHQQQSQLPSGMVEGATELPIDRTCSSPDYMNINQLYSIPVKMIPTNASYMGPTGSNIVDCGLTGSNPINSSTNIVTATTAVVTNTLDDAPTVVMGSSASVQPGTSSMASLPRSVGDGQESYDNKGVFMNREDYYKAPSTLRQPDLTMSTHLPSRPQSTMVMGMMTTGAPIQVASQSMNTGNVLLDQSIVGQCYTQQQMPVNCQFTGYSSVGSVPMDQPAASVIPANLPNMGNNNLVTGYTGYPDQWVDPVVDSNHMGRYLAHSTKVIPTTSTVHHPCRPASCGPGVSGAIINTVINSNVTMTNKMLPPPPPPKPQSKNSIAPNAFVATPYNELNEPNLNQEEITNPNVPKLGGIVVDAENNVVVNATNIIQSNPDKKGHFVEPVKPEGTVAPPANFVKERIKLLESKVNNENDSATTQQSSSNLSSLSSSVSLKVEAKQQNVNLRNQSKIFREIYSEPDVAANYDDQTDKSSTIPPTGTKYSSVNSVLSDLRKTAESNRGERQLTSLESSASINQKEGESTPLSDRGEADGSSGSNQPVCSKSSILANNHKQTAGGGSSSIENSENDDKGDDADDELSREYDASQYNANIPSSAKHQQKQILSKMIKTGVIERVGSNPPECVPTSSRTVIGDPSVTIQTVPELVMDSNVVYSTSMDNPAYVSSSYLEYAIKDTNDRQPEDDVHTNSAPNDEQPQSEPSKVEEVKSGSLEDIANLPEAPKIAPYYYSDLLPNANDGLELPINYREREKLSSRLQRFNNHNYGASRRGGGVDDDQTTAIGVSGKKRCITPEVNSESADKPSSSFVRDNQLRSSLRYTDYSRSEKRKSRSLENLDDDHLYENLEFLRSTNPTEPTQNPSKMMINHPPDDDGSEQLPELPVKQKNMILKDNSKKSSVTYSQMRKVVKFDDTMDQRDEHDQLGEEQKMKESTIISSFTGAPVMMETESESERSLIEGEGSQSGSYLDKKLRKRRSPRNRRSQDDLKNVSDSETTSKPPPPPPLPLGYNQHGYPYYCVSDNSNSKLQRKLSRSVGTGLQNEQDIYNSKIFSSAGELLGKTHEELVLLLIQLRRNQSHLASTCDSLRLQMESEEKMMEIEPQRREEHKSRYKELRESLLEAERQHESQFPIIDMVDNMVKLNHPGPGTSVSRNRQQHHSHSNISQQHQHSRNQFNRDYHHYNQQPDSSPTDNEQDFDFKRGKAVSTSYLDRFPESQGGGETASSSTTVTQPTVNSHPPPMVPRRGEQLKFTNYLSPPKKKETEDEVESEDQAAEQEKLIQYLKQDKDILEKTLEGVRSSLTNLSLNGSDGDDPRSTSSNVDKMKKQQQMLEGELGRVRGLIVQSAKRLEQRPGEEDPWAESDVLLARAHLDQILSATSTPTTTPVTNSSSSSSSKSSQPGPVSLEAELANIDLAIDSLHAKRKEILENFKKQKPETTTTTTTPTSTSKTSPTTNQQQQSSTSNNQSVGGKTSTSSGYGETDMDSMESRDLTPFNYLKGYPQLSPEEELATTSSGSNHLYENLDSNLVNYGYNNINRSLSNNKFNGIRSLDKYADDNQGRSDDSASETPSTTTSTTATTTSTRGYSQESNEALMGGGYNNNDNYGEYDQSNDSQQYTFQQPLLASNKTVRLVKRESERRRVTNKLTPYTTTNSTAINYNNNLNIMHLNNAQYFQHFPQENDLNDFPVYTVNHSDGTTTIESVGGGNCDNQFTYDTVTGKRPSTLNLIESSSSTSAAATSSSTIKSDERKEIDSSPTSTRSSLSNSANDLPALVGSSSFTFTGKDDLDLDKINNEDLIIRPTTSTSGYLSNVSQLHLSSNSSPTRSPSTLSTTWRSIDEDDSLDKSTNIKVINNQLSTVSPQSYQIETQSTGANHLRHVSGSSDPVKSLKAQSSGSFDEERLIQEIALSATQIEESQAHLTVGCSELNDEPTMEEMTKRTMKAESFRKMLSDAAYTSYTPIHRRGQSINQSFRATIGGLPSSSNVSALDDDPRSSGNQPLRKICSSGDIQNIDSSQKMGPQEVKTIFDQEKRRRAQLLALNSEIAKEATERSRKVASIAHGTHSPSSFI